MQGQTSRATKQTTRKKKEYQRDTSRGTIKQREEEIKRGRYWRIAQSRSIRLIVV